MRDIISYHIVPPGKLCVRTGDGLFRQATELETVQFFHMGVELLPLAHLATEPNPVWVV